MLIQLEWMKNKETTKTHTWSTIQGAVRLIKKWNLTQREQVQEHVIRSNMHLYDIEMKAGNIIIDIDILKTKVKNLFVQTKTDVF